MGLHMVKERDGTLPLKLSDELLGGTLRQAGLHLVAEKATSAAHISSLMLSDRRPLTPREFSLLPCNPQTSQPDPPPHPQPSAPSLFSSQHPIRHLLQRSEGALAGVVEQTLTAASVSLSLLGAQNRSAHALAEPRETLVSSSAAFSQAYHRTHSLPRSQSRLDEDIFPHQCVAPRFSIIYLAKARGGIAPPRAPRTLQFSTHNLRTYFIGNMLCERCGETSTNFTTMVFVLQSASRNYFPPKPKSEESTRSRHSTNFAMNRSTGMMILSVFGGAKR
eukprot:3429539-Rhodomonas_salina.2